MSREHNKNRLAHEQSPYLIQHADNPVDWYPWGDEAFARAHAEDKPIFLSIGYSTCHWCHVMERESFSDAGIAAYMNENFVCIKVDREERPDIDNVYMAAVTAMAGRGGWPLTVLLTPDGRPFYGGTYFPPEDRWGMPGLETVLKSAAGAWKNRRKEVMRSGEAIVRSLGADVSRRRQTASLGEETLSAAYAHFRVTFDARHAGFGHAPKFPMGHNISFLLRYAARDGESDALEMAERTLDAMADGGLYDHLGGGFHRYSTDEYWRIPHFEKMLYDQAVLARAYLEAYQATGRKRYALVAEETLDYVLRNLTGSEGGFQSAEDADSPLPGDPTRKSEGAFYLWTRDEVINLLGDEAGAIAAYHFGMRPAGNAVTDPHGELSGKNVLYLAHRPQEVAERFDMSMVRMEKAIAGAREALLDARSRRPRPHRDDKILTDWNGLMISSMAFAYRVLRKPAYREAAERAARFILTHLKDEAGGLLHRHRGGISGIAANLDDYAFLIHGLIDLYEATLDGTYLAETVALAGRMRELFWDEAAGGFFFTAADSEALIIRTKEVYDGAIPSGNSVAALDLVRLARLTGRPELESLADELMKAFSGDIAAMPAAHSFMLAALDFAIGPSAEIVIVEGHDGPGASDMADAVYSRFLPNRVLAMLPAHKDEASRLIETAPFLAKHRAVDGKTAAYVCIDRACRAPALTLDQLESRLDTLP